MRVMRTGLILALAVVFAILFVNVAFNEAAHAAATKPRAAAGVCAATIAQDLSIQVPKFTFDGSAFFATLKLIQAADGSYTANLIDFGSTTRTDCSAGDTGILVLYNNSYVLHIPSLTLGADSYWINFEHQPTSDGTVLFKISNYGNTVTGVTGEGSAFLSLTQATGNSVSNTQYEVQATFPGGTEANIVLTVLENQTYTPTTAETDFASQLGIDIYGAKVTHSETDDTNHSFTQYFVPYEVLPSRSAFGLAQHPSSNPLTKPLYGPESLLTALPMAASAGAPGEEKSGVSVTIDATLIKTGKKQAEKVVEMGFGKITAKSGSSVVEVYSTFDQNDKHTAWLARLDAVQACLDDPSNTFYVNDPALKQRDQDKLNSARADVESNTSAIFVNKVAIGAMSLNKVTAALWPIAAAAKGYSEYALNYVSEFNVHEAEAQVICSTVWKIDESWGPYNFYAVLCDGLNKPWKMYEDYNAFNTTYSFTPYSSTSDCQKPSCTIEGKVSVSIETPPICHAKYDEGTYMIDQSGGTPVVTFSMGNGIVTCTNASPYSLPDLHRTYSFQKGGKCTK